MNPCCSPVLAQFGRRARWFCPLIAAALLGAAETQTPPKPFTLYMGANLSIQKDKELFRVQNVKGSSFVIKTKAGETRVQMNYSQMPVKIERTLKLSENAAVIEKFKAQPTYSYATDPHRIAVVNKAHGDAITQDYAEIQDRELKKDLQALSYDEANANLGMKGFVMMPGSERSSAGFRNSEGVGGATGVSGQAMNASAFGKIENTAAPDFMERMHDDLRNQGFDAVELSFEVTSDKVYVEPYLVVLAQYREKPDAPESRLWVYAEAMEPITEKKQKVYVRKGGFPPGFELQNYQVHLYNHGEEIATNVAENRVTLTQNEAEQYLMLQYLGTHKKDTLPPKRALGKLPSEIRGRMDPNLFRRTYYAKVDPQGKPAAVFNDHGCTERADAFLSDAVKQILFYPALEKGRPVEGVVELRLPELTS